MQLFLFFYLFTFSFCESGGKLVPSIPSECSFYRRITVSLPTTYEILNTVVETASLKLDTHAMWSDGKHSGLCEELYLVEEKVLDDAVDNENVDWTDFSLVQEDNSTESLFVSFNVENTCDDEDTSIFFPVEFKKNDTRIKEFILFYGCDIPVNTTVSNNQEYYDYGWVFMTSNKNCSIGFENYKDVVVSEPYTLMDNKFLRSTIFLESYVANAHQHDGAGSWTDIDNVFLRCDGNNHNVEICDDHHRHETSPFTSDGTQVTPEYVDVIFCRRSVPWIVPGDLMLFDTDSDLPDGFDDVSDDYMDRFIRGFTQFGSLGGNNNHNHFVRSIPVLPTSSNVWRYGAWEAEVPDLTHDHPEITNVWSELSNNVPPFYSFRLGLAASNSTDAVRNYWQKEGSFVMIADNNPNIAWDRHFDSIGRFPRISTSASQIGGDFAHEHDLNTVTATTLTPLLQGRCKTGGLFNANRDHGHNVNLQTLDSFFEVSFTGLGFYQRNNIMRTILEIGDEWEVGINEPIIFDDDTEDDDDNDDDDGNVELVGTIIFISLAGFLIFVIIVLSIVAVLVAVFIARTLKKRNKADKDLTAVTNKVAETAMVEQELEESKSLFKLEKAKFSQEKKDKEEEYKLLEEEVERMKSNTSLVTYSTNMSFFPKIPLIEVKIGADVNFNRPKGMRIPVTIHRGEWKGKNVLIRRIQVEALQHNQLDGMKILMMSMELIYPLSHPNILKYHGYAELPGYYVLIISDDCLYPNFGDIINIENVTFKKRTSILKGLVSGFKYLHEKNILHGNICPSQVYLDGEGTPIIDMGIDKIFKISHEYNSCAAPEVVNPTIKIEEELDEDELNSLELKKDIYSFGILIYSLLTDSFDVYSTGGMDVQVGVEASLDEKFRPQSLPVNQVALKRMPKWWINLIDQYPMQRPSFESVMNIVEQTRSVN